MVRSRSVAQSIKSNLNTGVGVIGRMPVGALEISSEKEQKILLIKASVFFCIDLFVVAAIIFGFCTETITCGDQSPFAWQTSLLIVVLISLTLDFFTFIQVKKNYIKQSLSLASIAVDSLVFGCFIWGIVYIERHKICSDVGLVDAAYVLLLLVLLRVMHILLFVLYVFLVLPCYYMPDGCIFKKMLMLRSVDKGLVEEIESSEWTFHLKHPTEVVDAQCFMCL